MTKGLKDGGGARAAWMPFYGRDFYSSVHVLAMSWEERGVYQFLLWTAWDEGAIPADPAKLARIVGMHATKFRKVWQALAERWVEHPNRPGWLLNERQERVRQATGELSEKMRALAERKHAKEAAARMAAGQHLPSAAAPDPACETACGAAPEPASNVALLTIRHTPEARSQVDGWMDGGSGSSQDQNGEGVRTPSSGPPLPAGAVLNRIVQGVGRG